MIPGNADSCKYLTFEPNIPIDTENFKNIVSNNEFRLCIGRCDIFVHKLSLYMQLNNVTSIDNKFIITIQSDITVREILLASLIYHNVVLFHYTATVNYNVLVIVEYNSYDIEERNVLRDTTLFYNTAFQNIKCVDCINYINNNEAISSLDTANNKFTKGNTNGLTRLKIQLDGECKIDYDNIMIELLCYKISDNLMYVPFSGLNNYNDINENSYNSGVNMSEINNVQMKLYFRVNFQTNIKIHIVSLKYICYNNGICIIYYEMYNNEVPITSNIVSTVLRGSLSSLLNDWASENRNIDLSRVDLCPITHDIIGEYYAICG